jgi:hypothetical protein
MWKQMFKTDAIIITQDYRENTYNNPSIRVVKLSEILKDIGVNKCDEFKQEFHQIRNYRCRIIYNRGYYCGCVDESINFTTSQNDIHGGLEIKNGFCCNHNTDINLTRTDSITCGILRTFKTKIFVIGELERLIDIASVIPSAPPLD